MSQAILPSEVSEETKHERMLEMWIRETLALMRKPGRGEIVIHERQLEHAAPLLAHLYKIVGIEGPNLMPDQDRWTSIDKVMQGLRLAGYGHQRSPSRSDDDTTYFHQNSVEKLDHSFKKYPYLDEPTRTIAEAVSKIAARGFLGNSISCRGNRFTITI